MDKPRHLNLNVDPGRLVAAQSDSQNFEVYEVHAKHQAYDYLHFAAMSIEAMTRSICTLKSVDFPQDGYLPLKAPAFDMVFRLHMADVIDMALGSARPPALIAPMELGARPGLHERWAQDLRPWVTNLMRSGFLHLYEVNRAQIRAGRSSSHKLAKVVRDSCAHGGLIQTNRLKPDEVVEFRGMEFRANEHGRPLETRWGYGDYLILALCMFDELPQAERPAG